MNKRRSHSIYRLLLPAILAMLPMLVLSGSMAGSAQAGAPIPTSVGGANTTRPHQTVLRVYFRNNAERDSLAVELGAEELSTVAGYLTVLGDDAMLRDLQARGIRVEVDQALTVNANMVRFGTNAPNTFYGGYKTVEEMQNFLDAEVAAHPGLAVKVDYGDSWCKLHPGSCTQPSPYNGYDLLALHITNQAIAGPKPVFWFDTGIHPREIATSEVAMRFIAALLDNYDTDPDAHWLVDYQDIWVVPMFNPDGHHIVEAGGGGNSPYYQRKNANKTNGCTTYPPTSGTQFGTDLNRNFDFLWNCCGGSSGSACSQTYHGPTAASDPETLAAQNEISMLIPDQRGPNNTDPAPITATGILQSMHSNASLNLYPWGFTSSPSPNGSEMANIGNHLKATNAYPSGNNYQTGQPSNILYAVDGDSTDWSYGVLGIASYTTEVGGSDFLVPLSYVDSTLWPLNKGALMYQAKIARTPYLLAHGPDAANLPATPVTATVGSSVQLTATINYAWSGNTLSQNVGAAEYYVDTPPWAGGTAQPMQASDGSFSSPTEAVQAGLDTTGLTLGRHVVFVRGRGATDYSGYQTWGPVTALFLDVVAGGGGTPTATGTLPSATNTGTATRTRTSTAVATSTSTSTPTSNVTATATPCQVSTQDVSVSNFAYSPANLTIPAGSTVRWTVAGGTHTSTSDTNLWDSGTMSTGQNFSYTFNTPGTYAYHCLIHPGSMTGIIVVTEPCPGTPSATQTTASTQTGTVVSTRTSTATTVASGTTTSIATGTGTPAATNTAGPSATSTTVPPTACPIQFQDVAADNTFYPYVRCLACKGILGGYPCGGEGEPCGTTGNPYFRPGVQVSRGQIAKIVSQSAGFNEAPGNQIYEDVPMASPFYDYINRLSNRGYIGGYPCGQLPDEPCITPTNRPYFRPSSNATRGQLSKIVATAAMITDPVSGQIYTDVGTDSPFYKWIQQLSARNVMSGYPCGGAGEPCDDQNRPYFRPSAEVTRGQASKIVANTFFPGCQTLAQP